MTEQTKQTTAQQVTRAFADAFASDTRTDGTTFVRLTDEAPEWMRDLTREAHDDELPNDWRYRIIASLADDIAEAVDDGTALGDLEAHELTDPHVSVYTSDLAQWLADNNGRTSYCDEANDDFGPALSIVEAMSRGQYVAIRQMAGTLLEGLRREVEGQEAEQDGEG